jgi:hypothetical protein
MPGSTVMHRFDVSPRGAMWFPGVLLHSIVAKYINQNRRYCMRFRGLTPHEIMAKIFTNIEEKEDAKVFVVIIGLTLLGMGTAGVVNYWLTPDNQPRVQPPALMCRSCCECCDKK